MVKYLANAITSLRIIGSAVLLFFGVPSLPLYITYLLCGFSDMIDGAIARKTNAAALCLKFVEIPIHNALRSVYTNPRGRENVFENIDSLQTKRKENYNGKQ